MENERKKPEGQELDVAAEKPEGDARRSFLARAATAAAGAAAGAAVILTATGERTLAQELPKRKLTLTEVKTFARDLATTAGVPAGTAANMDATMERYLRPLVDASGKLAAASAVNISIAGSITISDI